MHYFYPAGLQCSSSVHCCVLGGAKELGINPKINNLAQAYDFAKYELLLISDSGIKSEKGLT